MLRTFVITALSFILLTSVAVAQTAAPNPNQGAFDKLSPGNQKIVQALFDAEQTNATSTTAKPLSRDDIAAMKQDGKGWGEIFKEMRTKGLVQEKNLGQVVRQESGKAGLKGRKDITEDRRNIKEDKLAIKKDRQDLRNDLRDVREDRRELRQDLRSGASPDKILADRQDLRQDRQDVRNDARDFRHDKQDLRNDRLDLRQDRQMRKASNGISITTGSGKTFVAGTKVQPEPGGMNAGLSGDNHGRSGSDAGRLSTFSGSGRDYSSGGAGAGNMNHGGRGKN